jgi:hypothetical protein
MASTVMMLSRNLLVNGRRHNVNATEIGKGSVLSSTVGPFAETTLTAGRRWDRRRAMTASGHGATPFLTRPRGTLADSLVICLSSPFRLLR